MKEKITIIDFNGYVRGTGMLESFWAEWTGTKVQFGGDWQDVPDMLTTQEPTQKQCYQWAFMHGA